MAPSGLDFTGWIAGTGEFGGGAKFNTRGRVCSPQACSKPQFVQRRSAVSPTTSKNGFSSCSSLPQSRPLKPEGLAHCPAISYPSEDETDSAQNPGHDLRLLHAGLPIIQARKAVFARSVCNVGGARVPRAQISIPEGLQRLWRPKGFDMGSRDSRSTGF
jgi:hypothetical protein